MTTGFLKSPLIEDSDMDLLLHNNPLQVLDVEEQFEFAGYNTTPKQSKQYFKTLCILMPLKDGGLYSKIFDFYRDHLLTALTHTDICHVFNIIRNPNTQHRYKAHIWTIIFIGQLQERVTKFRCAK